MHLDKSAPHLNILKHTNAQETSELKAKKKQKLYICRMHQVRKLDEQREEEEEEAAEDSAGTHPHRGRSSCRPACQTGSCHCRCTCTAAAR
jgi:hypothetical protein